jgi:glycine/D-amino acid oxidase-like deaminating enzyme
MGKTVDLLRDLVAELDLDCDYENPGFLRVATSEKYRVRIMEEIELAHKLGLNGIEWLDQTRLAQEVNSPMYLGAWWEPRCGILNPAKLAWNWKDVVMRQGAAVYEQTPVASLARKAEKIILTTPGGRVRADKVVLAANAWSHFLPQLRSKQIPVWTHIVLTEPIGPKVFEEIGWQNRQGIEDARNLVHYYRLTAGNRLLTGGRDVSLTVDGKDMDQDLSPPTFAGLKADMRQSFPALKDIRFTHERGGPVSVPIDMAPALGYLGDKNVVYSLGCVGHGVSLTHLNGKTLSDMVLGRQTDLTEVFFVNRQTIPWPPSMLRNLAIKAIVGYMHWEDKRFDAPAATAP